MSTPSIRLTSSNMNQLMPAAGASLIIFGKTPCISNDRIIHTLVRFPLHGDSSMPSTTAQMQNWQHMYWAAPEACMHMQQVKTHLSRQTSAVPAALPIGQAEKHQADNSQHQAMMPVVRALATCVVRCNARTCTLKTYLMVNAAKLLCLSHAQLTL